MLNLGIKTLGFLFKAGFKASGKTLKILGFFGKVLFIIFLGALALGLDANRENLKDLEG